MPSLNTTAQWASIVGLILAVAALVFTERGKRFSRWVLSIPRGMLTGVRLQSSGITNIFLSRKEVGRKQSPELIATIEQAKREVTIVAISLQRTIVHQGLADRLEVLLTSERPDLVVRFFLVDPNSGMVPYLASSSNRLPEELRAAIEASLARLYKAQKAVNSPGHERLVVRTHDCCTYNAIVAIDVPLDRDAVVPKGAFFLIENSLFGTSIDDRYALRVARPQSRMFRKVLASFQALSRYLDAPTRRSVEINRSVADNIDSMTGSLE